MTGLSSPARQRGFSLIAQGLFACVFILLAMLVIRVSPAVVEYFTIAKHVTAVAKQANSQGMAVDAIRESFDKRALVDDVQSLRGADLDVSKEAGEVVITFAYAKKVPLVGAVSLCFDFQGGTTPSGRGQ